MRAKEQFALLHSFCKERKERIAPVALFKRATRAKDEKSNKSERAKEQRAKEHIEQKIEEQESEEQKSEFSTLVRGGEKAI